MEDVKFKLDISIEKSKTVNESKKLVSGWASIAKKADGTIPLDWQGDVISPDMLEDASISFMLEYRESGIMHEGNSVATVVESIMFTKEKQQAIGIPEGCVPEGWFITVKVHDPEIFKKVENGVYKMFSIQGTAKRVKI